jgi:hypothetical protein
LWFFGLWVLGERGARGRSASSFLAHQSGCARVSVQRRQRRWSRDATRRRPAADRWGV